MIDDWYSLFARNSVYTTHLLYTQFERPQIAYAIGQQSNPLHQFQPRFNDTLCQCLSVSNRLMANALIKVLVDWVDTIRNFLGVESDGAKVYRRYRQRAPGAGTFIRARQNLKLRYIHSNISRTRGSSTKQWMSQHKGHTVWILPCWEIRKCLIFYSMAKFASILGLHKFDSRFVSMINLGIRTSRNLGMIFSLFLMCSHQILLKHSWLSRPSFHIWYGKFDTTNEKNAKTQVSINHFSCFSSFFVISTLRNPAGLLSGSFQLFYWLFLFKSAEMGSFKKYPDCSLKSFEMAMSNLSLSLVLSYLYTQPLSGGHCQVYKLRFTDCTKWAVQIPILLSSCSEGKEAISLLKSEISILCRLGNCQFSLVTETDRLAMISNLIIQLVFPFLSWLVYLYATDIFQ